MDANTGIAWCDSTANFWRGCTKVSEEKNGGGGCDNCYAEAMNNWLYRGRNWGPGAPRDKIATTPRIVRSWQRNAGKFFEQHGRRRRVFVNSVSDIFDNEVEAAWRAEVFEIARECQDLLFFLLTKRIGNAKTMLPPDWDYGYQNVMLLATVVNQMEVDRDVPKLLALPARWRGLSVEPQLGLVDLTCIDIGGYSEIYPLRGTTGCEDDDGNLLPDIPAIDWVVNGFESGRRPRPGHPGWASSLRDQCANAGVAYFFKQWGEWLGIDYRDGSVTIDMDKGLSVHFGDLVLSRKRVFGWKEPGDHRLTAVSARVGKDAAGSLLDGVEHKAWPKDFR